jgi:hypothetical protein
MKIYSFDTNPSEQNTDRFFNVFEKNMEYNRNITLYEYIIPREFEMRLDLISNDIYNSSSYIEELMLINNIISPYSLKETQVIFYCSVSDMSLLYVKDDMKDTDALRDEIIAASQKRLQIIKLLIKYHQH